MKTKHWVLTIHWRHARKPQVLKFKSWGVALATGLWALHEIPGMSVATHVDLRKER